MPKLKIDANGIHLYAKNKLETEKAKSIIGREYNKNTKSWHYPVTCIKSILAVFYSLDTDEKIDDAYKNNKLDEKLYKLIKKIERTQEEVNNLKKGGPSGEDDFLFAHQQLCREIAERYSRYAFFLDTGTGKTIAALQIIYDDVMNKSNKRKWLVVCKLSLIRNAWIADCEKYYPELKIVNLHKNDAAFEKEADIYIINYESFTRRFDKIRNLNIDGVIIDESSKMKSPKSNITKTLLTFSKEVERWYILSGEPAPNTMEEYFAQMKSIDPSLLGSIFSNFRAVWFYPVNRGNFTKYEITPEKESQMIQQIKKRAIYKSKEECFDLPGKVDVVREIEMPSDLKKKYATMKKQLYTLLGDDFVLAPNVAVSLGKLNQLTSGILIDEDQTHRVSDAKIKVLEEVLEEIPKNRQVIIWAHYKEEFRMIKELLGERSVTYNSQTDAEQVEPLVEYHYGKGSFNNFREDGYTVKDLAEKLFKDGKVKYFIANSASIGHGATLTNCSYSIYYCLTYSWENFKQSKDRIYRYSQKEKCTYIYLLMEKSIDYILFNTLQSKGDMSKRVLEHLKTGV